MKHTGTCPKCRNTKLLHVDQVAANAEIGTSQRHPMFQLAVTGDGPSGCNGGLEAYVCPQCRLVEFYLKTTLRADGKNVIEVTAPAQGPHRT